MAINVTTSLKNNFLIAMPSLKDPNFSQTVTYLCEHSEDGAMGIVINRPMSINLGEILFHIKMETTDPVIKNQLVYHGGPVQPERGFVLHCPTGDWDSTLKVTENIAVTTSQDILAVISQGKGPEQHLVALGYAGWAPGQLEQEIAANSWLNGPADPQILFTTKCEHRWQAAATLLNVDLNLISHTAGHA